MSAVLCKPKAERHDVWEVTTWPSIVLMLRAKSGGELQGPRGGVQHVAALRERTF